MSEAENKVLARRLLEEVVNAGAVDRLLEFYAKDCRFPNAEFHGLDGVRQHVQTYHECYPDLAVTVDGQVAEDDTVVTWWTMRATHSLTPISSVKHAHTTPCSATRLRTEVMKTLFPPPGLAPRTIGCPGLMRPSILSKLLKLVW